MPTRKVALITGASSGFGQLTAAQLADAGFQVFGASRRGAGATGGVEMLALDVTAQASVDAGVRAVLERAGRIDVLVNNAGRTHGGLIEETPLDVAMRMFDTNLWGAVRMTNAVLPAMRAQRSGLIVNVSSLAGLVGAPGQGLYSASKHALEGYTEALQAEVHRFGIRVALVEPGFFRTNLHHAMSRDARPIPDYDGVREKLEAAIAGGFAGGRDPIEVARTIAAIAQRGPSKLRYRVGTDARWVPRMKTLLPEALFRRGMRRRFGLDG